MRWWRRVVRARRLEIVDDDGRPWLVIGDAGGPRGLWVLGADRTQRVWLGVDGAGAGLAIGRAGTVVAGVGTLDDVAEVVRVGAYAFVADRSGRPVAGWYVDDAGVVRVVEPP